MVLAEALGVEQFRERVKIYATDVDEEALDAGPARHLHRQAGRGRPARAAGEVLRAQRDGRYVFRKDLRRSVIFGRHDLIQDAPDLPDRPAGLPQHPDVLQRRDPGAGSSPASTSPCATAGTCSWARPRCCWPTGSLFAPVDLKRRIFRKRSRGAPRDRLLRPAELATRPATMPSAGSHLSAGASRPAPWPRSSSTADGVLVARQRAGPSRCSVSARATSAGRSSDLELSYRPVELRSLHRAGAGRATAQSRVDGRRVARAAPARSRCLDVQVTPAGRRRREPSACCVDLHRRDRLPPAAATSWSSRTRSWRPPTRSCSRPTRSWRPPTRSCSRRSRSWRPPTRSSSPPTRSWRR